MMDCVIEYDMTLRLWALHGADGDVLATFSSRTAALEDDAVRGLARRGRLRMRDADGTFVPVPPDAPSEPSAR